MRAKWCDCGHLGGPLGEVPAADVAVVDATGAGDSFCGGMLAGLALGDDLADAARRGAATAGAALGASGSLSLLGGREALAAQLLRHYRGEHEPPEEVSDPKPDNYGIDVMRREIATIPSVINTQLVAGQSRLAKLAAELQSSGTSELVFVGCGDSAFVGQAASLAFNRHTTLRSGPSTPSILLATASVIFRNTVACWRCGFPGRSGARSRQPVEARAFGHRVVALAHDPDGPLAAAANSTRS